LDARCHICDTRLSVAQVRFEGTFSKRGTLMHLFCSDHCKDAFDTGRRDMITPEAADLPPMVAAAS
jgi:hypothetical protein